MCVCVALCFAAFERTTLKKKYINTSYEKKKLKKKKRKAKRGSLVFRRVWEIFFMLLREAAGSAVMKWRQSLENQTSSPARRKKELGPRNILNDSQTDFYFSQYNAHEQA